MSSLDALKQAMSESGLVSAFLGAEFSGSDGIEPLACTSCDPGCLSGCLAGCTNTRLNS